MHPVHTFPSYFIRYIPLSSHLRQNLESDHISSGFPNKILCAFLITPMRSTCSVHFISLDLMTLILFSKAYQLWSSSLCSLRLYLTFRNKLFFYGDEFLAPRPNPKLEDHPLSALRDFLFNTFESTLHNWRPSPPSAARGCTVPLWHGPSKTDNRMTNRYVTFYTLQIFKEMWSVISVVRLALQLWIYNCTSRSLRYAT
jgi:hypothetical protein